LEEVLAAGGWVERFARWRSSFTMRRSSFSMVGFAATLLPSSFSGSELFWASDGLAALDVFTGAELLERDASDFGTIATSLTRIAPLGGQARRISLAS
jgi:hypothetical protein